MEEFDLKSMWDDGKEQAHDYYKAVEDKVLQLAQEKSRGVLQKFKRRSEFEIILGTILLVLLLFVVKESTWLGIICIVALIIILSTTSIWMHLNIAKAIKTVNANNVVNSIEKYIDLLDTYQKRTLWLSTLVLPLLFVAGFVAGFGLANKNINDLLVPHTLIWFGGAFVITGPLFYFFMKKYVYSMIGKYADELKIILQNLKEEQEVT